VPYREPAPVEDAEKKFDAAVRRSIRMDLMDALRKMVAAAKKL